MQKDPKNVMRSSIAIHRIENEDQIGEFEGQWFDLIKAVNGSPFVSPTWVRSTLKTRLPESKPCIFAVTIDTRLVGIFPFLAAKTCHKTLGPFYDEYMLESDVIIDPLYADEVIDAFLEFLDKNRFKRFQFQFLSESSQCIELLRRKLRASNAFIVFEQNHIVAPSISFEASFDDYVAKNLKKKYKNSFKRKFKQIRDNADFKWIILQSQEIITSIDDLEHISKHSWQGRNGTGTFCRNSGYEFYRNLLIEEERCGECVVIMLYQSGRPIAFNLSLILNATCYGLKTEFDSAHADIAPGKFLIANLMDYLYTQKVTCIKFGSPLNTMKKEICNQMENQTHLTIVPKLFIPTLRFSLPILAKNIVKKILNKPVASVHY